MKVDPLFRFPGLLTKADRKKMLHDYWVSIRQRADALWPGCWDMLYETHGSFDSLNRQGVNYRTLDSVLWAMMQHLDELEARAKTGISLHH